MSKQEKVLESVKNKVSGSSDEVQLSTATIPDPQVSAQHSPRRSFSTAYKLKILSAYEGCSTALARGELLRKEGLYSSRISSWRKQRSAGRLSNKRGLSKQSYAELVRENGQLKKRLAQAQAIIDLQKKVSELLGHHILPHDQIGEKS